MKIKKTLKTFINTGLFMLLISHSYGLIYDLNDVINQNDSGSTTLLDNTTHPGFNGIDDTFDGSIIFNFTITYDTLPSGGPSGGDNFAIFQLWQGLNTPISIGAYQSDNWNGVRYNLFMGSQTDLTFGSNPVVEGQSQAFTMTIDYNAGAPDTGTLLIAGDSTVYDIGDYDYSFSEILFNTGLGLDSGHIASATNMSVSIVPEPATYALIFGAFAFGFVALRRRFKA